jgi:hypothetical protein
MTYTLLGQNLHETADRAKEYFSREHGAKKFRCEIAIASDLPLKPTWQATLSGGYLLCVDVRETPFSVSLYEFVAKCASRGLPIRLWVALPPGTAAPAFNAELRQARESGVGVVQIFDDGTAHVFHRPVPLSLFGLKTTNPAEIPKAKRDEVKTAEATFLDGTPAQGCQAICQALEQVTRDFAEYTYHQGWWRTPANSQNHKAHFFQNSPWAKVLEELESRIDVNRVRSKSSQFSKHSIVKARGHTDWRNKVSHSPKTLQQLKERDAKLRTMFEATRDVLVEWYAIARPLKLVK